MYPLSGDQTVRRGAAVCVCVCVWGGGGVRNMKKMRFFTTRRGMQQYIQGSQFASFQGGAVTPFLVLSMGVLG